MSLQKKKKNAKKATHHLLLKLELCQSYKAQLIEQIPGFGNAQTQSHQTRWSFWKLSLLSHEKKKEKTDSCSSKSSQNFLANLCNFKTDAKVPTLIHSEFNNWGHNKTESGGYFKT